MGTSYLVCYDICDYKALRKMFQTMRGFGDHLQYSVFECQFTASGPARCRAALSALIHHEEDQVLFVHLGPAEGRGDPVSVPSYSESRTPTRVAGLPAGTDGFHAHPWIALFAGTVKDNAGRLFSIAGRAALARLARKPEGVQGAAGGDCPRIPCRRRHGWGPRPSRPSGRRNAG